MRVVLVRPALLAGIMLVVTRRSSMELRVVSVSMTVKEGYGLHKATGLLLEQISCIDRKITVDIDGAHNHGHNDM